MNNEINEQVDACSISCRTIYFHSLKWKGTQIKSSEDSFYTIKTHMICYYFTVCVCVCKGRGEPSPNLLILQNLFPTNPVGMMDGSVQQEHTGNQASRFRRDSHIFCNSFIHLFLPPSLLHSWLMIITWWQAGLPSSGSHMWTGSSQTI